MPIAEHVGRDSEIVALGQKWKVGRWTRRVWNDFLEWAKPRIADPLDVAEKALAKFPAHLHEVIVRHAIDRSQMHLTAGSTEVQSLLGTVEGSVYLLYLLLKDSHPGVTEDMAFDIATEVGGERMRKAFDVAAGKVPAVVQGNEAAPAE